MTTLSSFIMLLIPVFLIFFFVTLKYASKSKDEHDKKILLKSYQYSSTVFPIGWLLVEIYYRFFNAIFNRYLQGSYDFINLYNVYFSGFAAF